MNSNEELRESWEKATDSMVIQAATKDWNEYSAEAQEIIEAEVRKRNISEIINLWRDGKDKTQIQSEDHKLSGSNPEQFRCEACKSTGLNTKTGRCASCELPSEYVGYCMEYDRFWALKPGKQCPEHNHKLQKYKSAMSLLRIGNLILDQIIIYILFFVLGVVLSILGMIDENTIDNIDPLFNYLLNLSVIYLYYFIFETICQRTPAKFITGTKVITGDGKKPTVGTIALRNLIRFIPFEAFSFLGERVYGWHDEWSKTYVIKAKRFKNTNDNVLNQMSNLNGLKDKNGGREILSDAVSTPYSNKEKLQLEKDNYAQTNEVLLKVDATMIPISLEKPQKCANCETIIGKLEKAYFFNGNIVCYKCSIKLAE